MMQEDRNHLLDILKGIFAIFVILLHFAWQNHENESLLFIFCINFAVPGFLFISGYVSAKSFRRRDIDSFSRAYSLELLIPRLLRIVIPFTLAFAIEYILYRINGLFLVNLFEYGLLAFIFDWFKGGYGQGSYYFPVVMQFILTFPVIYFILKKNGKKGLVLMFFANIGYEVLKAAYGMNGDEYRLLFFRYLFVASYGCYCEMYDTNRKMGIFDLLELLFGIGFIGLFQFTDYSPKIIVFWTTTSVFTCLYIIPVLRFLLKKVPASIQFYPLELLGKASYNIFLVQMIFYVVYFEKLYNYCDRYYLTLLLTVAICVVVGLVFYMLEHRFTSFLIKQIKKMWIR